MRRRHLYTRPLDEQGYLDILEDILKYGELRGDRTGVGTHSMFGMHLDFDLAVGFPLLTTKKVFFKGIVEELLWFLSGSTNAKDLQAKGVKIWDEWATKEQCAKFGREEGDLGPVYGHQWRNFGAKPKFREEKEKYITGPYGTESESTRLIHTGYYKDGTDQISALIEGIKRSPEGRRHIVSGWNPWEANLVALPPCHTLFQFYVSEGKNLECHLYQRSGDMFLGVPFNIASYALLTHMVAQVCGLKASFLTISFGDLHVYKNHADQVREQLSRKIKDPPQLIINPEKKDIFSFTADDFKIEGYDPHPAIKAPVAV